MLARSLLQRCSKTPIQQLTSSIFKQSQIRTFQQSSKLMSGGEGDVMSQIYGVPKEGVYSNLPFQVKNRKFIPFQVWYWGVLGFFFAFPFLSTAWQMYKSGAFNPPPE
ncbi:COX8 [Candida pseudojiufengensis]|uniref:COX8 n=1 Tax=Candida pseudojiufengensis TaxID=497109 RepID=UPI00222447BC|nr:COX8 [Candida pseudojiufengensis]KAI5964681.1 COX8 [Candida pseudojiufengensis]